MLPDDLHAWKGEIQTSVIGLAWAGGPSGAGRFGDLHDHPGFTVPGLGAADLLTLATARALGADGWPVDVLTLAELHRLEEVGTGPPGGPLRRDRVATRPWPGASPLVRELYGAVGAGLSTRAREGWRRAAREAAFPPGLAGRLLLVARTLDDASVGDAPAWRGRELHARAAATGPVRFEATAPVDGLAEAVVHLTIDPTVGGEYYWRAERRGGGASAIQIRCAAQGGVTRLRVEPDGAGHGLLPDSPGTKLHVYAWVEGA